MSSPSELNDNSESQPLLKDVESHQNYQTGDEVSESEAISHDSENAPLVIPSSPTKENETPRESVTRWTILYWGFILGFVVFLVVLLIKAIAEADDVTFDWDKALKSAIGGGVTGAAAMVLQVLTLMPLRTIMNYQYRFGTTTSVATKTLYRDGGWRRYYQGLTAALIQGPVSRFGDAAANTGILALLESNPFMRTLPAPIQTIFVSLVASSFRILLLPIDTVKTTLQAQGKQGWGILKNRVRRYGITSLWYGALATAAATFVGNYPWWTTYDWLREILPKGETLFWSLSRQAFVGFCASIVSDTISNSIRVVKTYRQVNDTRIGYVKAAQEVINKDGWIGLFGRGLKTRIISNGMQGLMFSVLWKLLLDLWNKT